MINVVAQPWLRTRGRGTQWNTTMKNLIREVLVIHAPADSKGFRGKAPSKRSRTGSESRADTSESVSLYREGMSKSHSSPSQHISVNTSFGPNRSVVMFFMSTTGDHLFSDFHTRGVSGQEGRNIEENNNKILPSRILFSANLGVLLSVESRLI